MQLYFIRHAQSTNNLLYERTGYDEGREADPELTGLGRRQIEVVADFLATGRGIEAATTRDAEAQNLDGFRLTHLYASMMVRAMDTAAAIAGAVGLTPVARADLCEVGGMWLADPDTGEHIGLPGPSRAVFEARYPQFVLPSWLNNEGWWNRPAETFADSYHRAQMLVADLLAHHGPDDRVAVVSHGMFYNVLLRAVLNMPVDAPVWFVLNNVAVSRIDLQTESTRLAYQNRVDFLPPEMVT